jgi:hypothetical protein
VISHRPTYGAPGRRAVRTIALATAFAVAACSNDVAPTHGGGAAITIVAPADSVFEGDVIRLTARVVDDAGAEVPNANVSWASGDTTLARVTNADSLTLLRPGTVRITARSGASTATYDLAIGRLVATKVELTPPALSLGRGDRVQVVARVVGQGNRTISGRTIAFSSADSTVAVIGSPDNTVGGPGFLIAVGPGSTTIAATADGVTGTVHVGVVVADTNFVLTHFNGAPLPALVAADSVSFNGVKEFDEVYADTGTLVLSGLAQERYSLGVHFSQYHVVRNVDSVQRELRLSFLGEIDRGVVTVGPAGSLSMLSELIGPHLEHSATLQSDGYLVHFREPGDDFFLDLKYERVRP